MQATTELNAPLVSVIVPSYNHERFITQCVESVMQQTYKNFELTVIDDGSKDGSREILKQLQEKYTFNLVLQENIGLTSTLNKGIQNYAEGKYVSFCASDDYWALDKLEKQVAFMEQNAEFPVCFGKVYMVDLDGNVIPYLTEAANKFLKGGYIFKEIIFQELHPPVNALFRKSIFEEVGYYKNTWADDFYMDLKIAEKHPFGFIDDYLNYYRRSPEVNDVKSKMINQKTIYSHLDSINEYKHSPYYKKAIKLWYLRCFYWYLPYRSTKKLAFKGMIRNLDQLTSFNFLKAIFKFMVLWN
ncbi:glycosyltransferase family A protein [Mucilaginibacter sp. BT774]|uniref:glycosyltransferase family 2 protein n=1 Tax=Mucilaginibacter sp. BT774 TaxID=3062276 RepID=UPI002676C555|nr:glycosyltransferase family A protein [Mucilaginibacter sp. BT774]MDO3625930.1 glycosyltransferase family A protein [Mucilaginibacter sp. BT774]